MKATNQLDELKEKNAQDVKDATANGQRDKLKKWMNTEIEDASSSHSGSVKEVEHGQQRSR